MKNKEIMAIFRSITSGIPVAGGSVQSKVGRVIETGHHAGRQRRTTLAACVMALALAGVSRHAVADGSGDGSGSGEKIGHGSGSGSGAGSRAGKGGRDTGPIAVRVETAVKRVAPRVVSVVAALTGRRQADVYTKVLGRISAFGPGEGDPVKAGETLFRIDRSDPGETFLNSPVLSPIAGWVGRWHFTNVGEQVSPSDAVVTIVDDTALRAQVFLPTNDWLLVKKDTKVTAVIAGEKRVASILTIAQSADPASGRGSLTIEIANPKRDWRAGLYATLSVELDPKERMLVGSAGMSITDQGSYLYIVDESSGAPIARRVAVTFDVVNSDTVEILSGLQNDAKVISAGSNLLGDKSPVKIVSDDAKPDGAAPAPTAAGKPGVDHSENNGRKAVGDKQASEAKAAVVP